MSKEYRVAVAADDAKTRLHGGTHQAALALQNSIKVSFRVGDALNLMSGSEGRVPVQLHELQQVCFQHLQISARLTALGRAHNALYFFPCRLSRC